MQGLTRGPRVDHSASETPVGSGYYAKRQHKSGGKFNWKLVKANRSTTLRTREAIENISIFTPANEQHNHSPQHQ